MALRFYNTLSRRLEEFEPLDPPHVRIYACGPTVYQLPHIGNYRTFLLTDLLHRYLLWKGFRVTFVMNLTDVDDRIIERAGVEGLEIEAFTAPYIEGFFDELEQLGVRPASAYPRATRHIPEMIRLVQSLMMRGHAYDADGSVYFDIRSFPSYGKLSRVDLSSMRRGERVAADQYDKVDVRDFALWKAARDEDRRVGAAWPAPWSEGRPGWHLECSAMSMAHLGTTFDIHLGGEDLIFPHHEDEIAQSEGATGKPFARFWLHTKHLLLASEKMSKSVGNVVRLAELLEDGYSPAVIRYLLLSAHYRSELSFSESGLADAQAALRRLLDFEDRLQRVPTAADDPASSALAARAEQARGDFETALDDDLNVPAALGALFTFVREANVTLDRERVVPAAHRQAALQALQSFDDVLGVLSLARAHHAVDEDFARWVDTLVQRRQDARARRDFAAADAIRDELAGAGVTLEDTPQGPRWKRSP